VVQYLCGIMSTSEPTGRLYKLIEHFMAKKDKAKDAGQKDTVSYIVVSTEVRDAIGDVLKGLPYADVAHIMSILANSPVRESKIKADAEEKKNTAPEGDQAASEAKE